MGFWDIFGGSSRKSENKSENMPRADLSPLPVSSIEGRVVNAFIRVKQDITLLSSWTKYLRHKDLMNEQRHTHTQRELGVHKTLIEGLKQEAAELKSSVNELRTELAAVKHAENRFVSGLNPNLIRTKSEPNPERKRTPFETRVVSMLRSRKKDYVLKQILELASTKSHSTSEIEEIIVGEKALCGRTAFYDYLRELKHKKMISQAEKGEKKVVVQL